MIFRTTFVQIFLGSVPVITLVHMIGSEYWDLSPGWYVEITLGLGATSGSTSCRGVANFFSLLRTSGKLNKNYQLEPTGIPRRASRCPAQFLQQPANSTRGRSRLPLQPSPWLDRDQDLPLTRGSCGFKPNCYSHLYSEEGRQRDYF